MQRLNQLSKKVQELEETLNKLIFDGKEKDKEILRLTGAPTNKEMTTEVNHKKQLRQNLDGNTLRAFKYYKTSNNNLQHEKVWKEECAFTFASPAAENGLYFNLFTLQAFSREYVSSYDLKINGPTCLYLKIHWKKKKKTEQEEEEEKTTKTEEPPPKRLAIGVEGGFSPEKKTNVEFEKSYCLVLPTDNFTNEYSLQTDDEALNKLIESVISKNDASRQVEVTAWEATMDVFPSQYAMDLVQLNNGIKISSDPKTWKCAESGMGENLWLNLSTGYIGSGRANWDGSGGTGAALKHYESTGKKYPLAVKLGTITPDGKADVYSYAEDSMVIDPLLNQHLKHWGINVGELAKTEKTIAEMEVDLNVSYDWMRLIDEKGDRLEKCKGSFKVGLVNLGNSCYCNSVLQCLFCLPTLQELFSQKEEGSSSDTLLQEAALSMNTQQKPQLDLFIQLKKLGLALRNPEKLVRPYMVEEEEKINHDYVTPRMLKNLLAEGHVDFSTSQQQDAAEYFLHVLNRITREAKKKNSEERMDVGNRFFKFVLEERLEDLQSGGVKYSDVLNNFLLPVNIPPLDTPQEVSGKNDGDQKTPKISLESCVYSTYGADAVETIEDYVSPVSKTRGLALKCLRIKTFPKYLMIQLKKFKMNPDWTSIKLNCNVLLPQSFDFAQVKSLGGLQSNEMPLLPTTSSPAKDDSSKGFAYSEQVLQNIQEMGFSLNAAKRAAKFSKNNVETAMNWIMEHLDDADLNSEVVEEDTSEAAASSVDGEKVETLISMGGFPKEFAVFALKQCNSDLERSADWLFSRSSEEIVAEMTMASSSGASVAPTTTNIPPSGSSKYRLKAVISHIGKSTHSGHYVAHVCEYDDAVGKSSWLFFNDDKVSKFVRKEEGELPPLEQAYCVLYEQV